MDDDTLGRELQRAMVESACTEEERRGLLYDVRDLLTSGRTSVAFFKEPECSSPPIFKPENLVLGSRYYTRPSREMAGLRAVRTGQSQLLLIEAGGETVQVEFGEPQQSGPLSPVPKSSRGPAVPAAQSAAPAPRPSSSFAMKLGRRRGASAPERGAATSTGTGRASASELVLHQELEAANLELMRRRRELRDHQVRLSEAEMLLEDKRSLQDKHRELAEEAARMKESHAEELQQLRNEMVEESKAHAIAVKDRAELQRKARAHISALQARHEESVQQQLSAAQSQYETELRVVQDEATARLVAAPDAGGNAAQSVFGADAMHRDPGDISKQTREDGSVATSELVATQARLVESDRRAAAAEQALHESNLLREAAEQQASSATVRLAVLQSEKDGVVNEWSRAEVRSAKLEAAHADARMKLKKARQERDQLRLKASVAPTSARSATAVASQAPVTPTRLFHAPTSTPNSEHTPESITPIKISDERVRNTHFELWQAQQKEEQLRAVARKHEMEARTWQAKHAKTENLLQKATNSGRMPVQVQSILMQVLWDAVHSHRTLNGHACFDLASFFKAVDRDGSGSVDHTELQIAIETLDVWLSATQLEQLLGTIDTDHDGTIGFSEFERWMSSCKSLRNRTDATALSSEEVQRMQAAMVSLKAERAALEEAHQRQKEVWRSRESELTAELISKNETMLKANAENSELLAAIKEKDITIAQNQTVCDSARSTSEPMRTADNSKAIHSGGMPVQVQSILMQVLWDAVHSHRTLNGHACFDLASFFKAVDRDGSGSVDHTELQIAIETLDVWLSATQLEQLLGTIDTDHDGTIGFSEFERWMSSCKSLRNRTDATASSSEEVQRMQAAMVSLKAERAALEEAHTEAVATMRADAEAASRRHQEARDSYTKDAEVWRSRESELIDELASKGEALMKANAESSELLAATKEKESSLAETAAAAADAAALASELQSRCDDLQRALDATEEELSVSLAEANARSEAVAALEAEREACSVREQELTAKYENASAEWASREADLLSNIESSTTSLQESRDECAQLRTEQQASAEENAALAAEKQALGATVETANEAHTRCNQANRDLETRCAQLQAEVEALQRAAADATASSSEEVQRMQAAMVSLKAERAALEEAHTEAVATMRADAEAASRRHQEARDSYTKDAEVWRSRESELIDELASKGEALMKANAESSELLAATKEKESSLAETAAAAADAAALASELQSRCDDLQRALDATEEELSASLAEANARSEAVAALEAEREACSVREQELTAKYENASAEWASREADLLSNIESSTTSLQESRDECAQLRTEQQASAEENAALAAEKQALGATLETANEAHARCNQANRDLETRCAQLQAEVEALQRAAADATASSSEEVQRMQAAMVSLKAERAALEEAHTEAVATMRADAEAASRRHQEARDSHTKDAEVWRSRESELIDELASKGEALMKANAESSELLAATKEKESSLAETAAAAADAAALASELQSRCDDLQRALDATEEELSVSLAEANARSEAVAALEAEREACSVREQELTAKYENASAEWASREADLLSNIESSTTSLQESRDECAQLRTEQQASAEENAALAAEKQALGATLETANEAHTRCNQANRDLETRCAQLQAEVEALQRAAADATASSSEEVQRMQAAMVSLKAERAALEEAHTEAVATMRADAEAASRRHQEARDSHTKDAEVWRSRESELIDELASKGEALMKANAESSELLAATKEKESSLAETAAAAADAAALASELQSRCDDLQRALDATEEELSVSLAEANARSEAVAALEAEREACSVREQELTAKYENASAEWASREADLLSNIESSTTSLQESRDECAQLAAEKQALGATLETANEAHARCNQANRDLETRCAQLQAEVEALQRAAADATASSSEEVQRMQAAMVSLKAERAALEEAHTEAVATMRADAEAASRRHQEARDSHTKDAEVWRSRESELIDELASKGEALMKANAESSELLAATKEKESSLAETAAAAADAAALASELQSRCDDLQRALDATEEELSASLAEANARSEAVAALEAEREACSVREQELTAKYENASAEWASREADLLSNIESSTTSLQESRDECAQLRTEQQASAEENAALLRESLSQQKIHHDLNSEYLSVRTEVESLEAAAAANNVVMSTQVSQLRSILSQVLSDQNASIQRAEKISASYAHDRDVWLSQQAVLSADLDVRTAELAEMKAHSQRTTRALAAAQLDIQQLSLRELDAQALYSKDAALWKDREMDLQDRIATTALESAELRSEIHGIREAEEVLLSQRRILAENLEQAKVANGELESQCAQLQKLLKLAEQQAAGANDTAEASAGELRNVQKQLELLQAEQMSKQTDSAAVADLVLNRATVAEARCAELEAALVQAENSARQACASLQEKLATESCRAADLSRRLDVSATDSLAWRSRFEDESAVRERLQNILKEHQGAERLLMQDTRSAKEEANARLSDLEAALRNATDAHARQAMERSSETLKGEVIEAAVNSRVETIEAAFQAQLKNLEDVAARQLTVAERNTSVLQQKIAELTQQLADAQNDGHDWFQLEQDLATQMKKVDQESRKRKKAEARLSEAWEELSNLHDSVDAGSCASVSSTHRSASSRPSLEECLREQIVILAKQNELVETVHAQIIVDTPFGDHRCDIRIERSETNEPYGGISRRSAVEMWAETTGTKLRPGFGNGQDTSDDISPIPRGDVSSVDEHTRAQLITAREELAELSKAKHSAEKELLKEQKLRRQAELVVSDLQNTSVSAVDHENALAACEERAQAWILRIQVARKAERQAIEDERREALSERDALRAELSWHQSQTILSADEMTVTGPSPSAAVSGALSQFCE